MLSSMGAESGVRALERIAADGVVVAAGIRPNAELGRKAGLEVNQGILVNDHMETSRPSDIFCYRDVLRGRVGQPAA